LQRSCIINFILRYLNSILFLFLFVFIQGQLIAHAFEHSTDFHCKTKTEQHIHSAIHSCQLCDWETTHSFYLSTHLFFSFKFNFLTINIKYKYQSFPFYFSTNYFYRGPPTV